MLVSLIHRYELVYSRKSQVRGKDYQLQKQLWKLQLRV